MTKKILKIFSFTAVFAYIAFCAAVYIAPQYFFYKPSSQASDLEKAHHQGYPAQKVEYTAQDGTKLYGWYVPPTQGKPVVVFMHGNSYNIEAFFHKQIPLIKLGYGSFMPEYRGFGDIPGTISQNSLKQDSVAAIRWLYSQGYRNSQIYLYGMSLGSFTATHAAYSLGLSSPFAGLILEVPFDSLYAVVKDVIKFPLPLDYIIKDKHDNIGKIKQLRVPLLVMGAEKDTVVPVARAQNLFSQARQPKKLIIYPNAQHSTLYNHNNHQDILEWLKDNEKTRP